MTSATPRWVSASATDTGRVRSNNEDRVYTDDARGIFMVVDGVGGHEAGEHAADLAVEHIVTRLGRQTDTVEQRVREAITLANNAIHRAAQENPAWTGMACVLTVAVIQDGMVTVGHVGDSRLYRIRRGRIDKMTHDHSPVGEREDRGELTEFEAMRHPRRNEVFRDVGSETHAPLDGDFIELLQFPLEPDSALLLCSDGLSDALPSARILAAIEQSGGDRDAAVQSLVSAASAVGHDNVSAVLIEGPQFRRQAAAPAGAKAEPAVDAVARREPVWKSRPAFLAYGVVLGALATIATMFLVGARPPAAEPKRIEANAATTLGAAIEGARPGDTVVARPGIYRETVRLKSGVDVIAEPPYEAVIEGTLLAEGVADSRAEGLQIKGNVRAVDSDVVLSRCDVSRSPGPGVEWGGNSRGAITGCRIHDNAGPGILVAGSATPAIEANTIAGNGLQRGAPAPGIWIQSTVRLRVERNYFDKNGAEGLWLPAANDGLAGSNFFGADRRPKTKVVIGLGSRP